MKVFRDFSRSRSKCWFGTQNILCTACSSCGSPIINLVFSAKTQPPPQRDQNFVQMAAVQTQNSGQMLNFFLLLRNPNNPLLFRRLTVYSAQLYHKDERALPGYLQSSKCSVSLVLTKTMYGSLTSAPPPPHVSPLCLFWQLRFFLPWQMLV